MINQQYDARAEALKDHQDGKILLKTDKVSKRTPITIAPQKRRDARKKLTCHKLF